ncbi:MAG: MauE/DoxX family redox-associated membrane protein [Mycobacteriales bacterium]
MSEAVAPAAGGRLDRYLDAGPDIWTQQIRPWIGTALRILLGVVWIVAAAQKVGDPAAFVRAVRAYDATPEWLSTAIGYGLPYLEFGLGALLIAGLATRLGAALSGLLMIAFIIGIAQASARGLQLACGCFGGGGQLRAGQTTSYTADILRDVALLIAAVLLAVWPVTKFGLDDLVRRGGADSRASVRVGPRRTKQAQAKLAALQVKRRKEAGRRVQIASAAGMVILIAIGLIGIAVQDHRIKTQVVVPAAAQGTAIVVGKASAPVTVDVYEDFICPVCGDFESSSTGSAVSQLVNSGKARFRYHMVDYLDASSKPAGYSTRAANAAAAAAVAGKFAAYHAILFKNQPAENSAGLSNTQLISYGTKVGITSADFATAVHKGTYAGWVKRVANDASKSNVTGTPTVRINGKDVTRTVNGSAGYPPDAATLKKAVADATSSTK